MPTADPTPATPATPPPTMSLEDVVAACRDGAGVRVTPDGTVTILHGFGPNPSRKAIQEALQGNLRMSVQWVPFRDVATGFCLWCDEEGAFAVNLQRNPVAERLVGGRVVGGTLFGTVVFAFQADE